MDFIRRGSMALLFLVPLTLLFGPSQAGAASRAVVTVQTAEIGSPGNPSVGVVPFTDAIYTSCDAAPTGGPACQEVGGVSYDYGIGKLEVTETQWVKFLNTIDPAGKNKHRLWVRTQSSSSWPEYGQTNFRKKAKAGRHYRVASKAWADKPYAFATFLSAARFVNSLYNGDLLAKKKTVHDGFKYTTYKVRLSRNSDTGMYRMKNRKATRSHKTGFVVPSQDEWIKAAYYDPKGGGKFSYWDYPTNPGLFVNCPVDTSGCSSGQQPAATQLDANGNVTNAGTQPLATFEAVPGTAPDWCPQPFTETQCAQTPVKLFPAYGGNVSSVGQALTRSPWGTLDQGGNVVEITDTIAPPPELGDPSIVWRRWHGGVVTATAYQMWLSAVGVTPQTVPGYSINPFRGIRIVVQGM